MLAHERNGSNGFFRYLVTEEGVHQYPTQFIGSVHYPVLTTLKDTSEILYRRILDLEELFHMNADVLGNKIVVLSIKKDENCLKFYDESETPNFDLFDFNRCTGELSIWVDLSKYIPADFKKNHGMWLGNFFSPMSNYVYFTAVRGDQEYPGFFSYKVNPNLYRINLGKYTFETLNTKSYPPCLGKTLSNSNLVYLNRNIIPYEKNCLGVIKNPDAEDINAIGFDSMGVFCGNKKMKLGLPNNPHYDLGPVPLLPLQKQLVAYRDTICPQDTARLGGYFTAGRFVHQWSPIVGLSYVPGDSGTVLFHPTVIPKQDTLYTYMMTTSGRPNSCHDGEMTTDTFRVLVHGRNHRPCFVSIPEPEAPPSPKILVYPNPTNGTLYLKADGVKMLRFMLYNPNGQVVFEQNLSASEATLHIGDLADGTYLCKITTTEGIFTQKVVLAR